MTTTGRLYAKAQEHFGIWCADQGVGIPDHADVARYLEHCIQVRGVYSAAVHLSAIADLIRSTGGTLDTRHEAVQAVMASARAAIRS